MGPVHRRGGPDRGRRRGEVETEVLHIKKINNKKYRLYAGPFENFNSLKSTYISLNKLGFADLDIIKDLVKND